MRRVAVILLAPWLAACEPSSPPAEPPTAPAATAPAADVPAAPPVTSTPSPLPLEPLPRATAGVTLGNSRAEVQATLGPLDCHDNPDGFQVCAPHTAPSGTPNKFEAYFIHDRVVSLAYESDIGANVWDFLNGLMARFGTPSLDGVTQRDKQGRTHEIYGWKDERTIYSVRFIWLGEAAERQLSSTAITLWDRPAYQQWEAEKKRAHEAPPSSGEPT